MLLLISSVVMILLDTIFLFTLLPLFKHTIQQVQGSPLHINYKGVLPCYLLLIVALNYFIIYPHKSPQDAFLLGLCIYGVYETTNYAIFKDWPLHMALIDTLWGGIFFAMTTLITYQLHKL